MKKLIAAVVLILALGTSMAEAQTPYIAVYFDQNFQQESSLCRGFGVFDTLFVVAHNFNMFFVAVEYGISYGPSVTWIADFDLPTIVIGSTPTGIAEASNVPMNGFEPANIAKVAVKWNCDTCAGGEDRIRVVNHPETGAIRYTRFPDLAVFHATGLTSLICSTVPVEETTWGKVKALYTID